MSLEAAREAIDKGEWGAAWELFDALDEAELAASDLEAKADAAWWLARIDDSIAVRQRAFSQYVAAGDHRRAAYMAWFLYWDLLIKGERTVASGWLQRASRHLEDQPECVEQGLVLLAEAGIAKDGGDLMRAEELAGSVADLASRCASKELGAYALDALGRIRIAAGDVSEGLRLLDEAMSSVVAGELEPLATGFIYCNAIGTCLQIADLRRAGEWSAAARAWCDCFSDVTPFHGLCRIYHAQVSVLSGAWESAEDEARRAIDESEGLEPFITGEAWYSIGEIMRRRGDLRASEAAFTEAHEFGREPQPGLALVRAAQGDLPAALAALRSALGGDPGPLAGARLLAALVDVALSFGDAEAAAAAATELQELAAPPAPDAVAAMAAQARAAVELERGDATAALALARRARSRWQDLKLPYEVARARVLAARAARAAGDEMTAELEAEAARATFERLGARRDAEESSALLGGPASVPGGLSPREVEVLRLVAAGKTNREIAADLVISEHTVSRHLQNIFSKLGVSTRAGATAFAFERDLV